MNIPQRHLLIQNYLSTNHREVSTDINLDENFVAGVVAVYGRDFEDAVREAGGHVDYLLELDV